MRTKLALRFGVVLALILESACVGLTTIEYHQKLLTPLDSVLNENGPRPVYWESLAKDKALQTAGYPVTVECLGIFKTKVCDDYRFHTALGAPLRIVVDTLEFYVRDPYLRGDTLIARMQSSPYDEVRISPWQRADVYPKMYVSKDVAHTCRKRGTADDVADVAVGVFRAFEVSLAILAVVAGGEPQLAEIEGSGC